MGIVFGHRNNLFNNNNTNTNSPNDYHLPNSRLNLIYNQFLNNNSNTNHVNARSGKKKKFYNTSGIFNVSFSPYFYIAGRRFKNLISQAQTFLFGDQLDLSFVLAHKPVIFPYEAPLSDMPSKYLQSLVNIRKDTVRLIKCNDSSLDEQVNKYNIEFKFDCDCDVRIKIHYFCTEKFLAFLSDSDTNSGEQQSGIKGKQSKNRQLIYSCGCSKYFKSKSASSIPSLAYGTKANGNAKCFCLNDDTEPIIYKRGANILFQQSKHLIEPSKFDFEVWQFSLNTNYYPIAIECTPVNEKLAMRHAHVTLAYIDKSPNIATNPLSRINSDIINQVSMSNNENSGISLLTTNNLNNAHLSSSVGCINQPNAFTYQIKPIKQKQLIDGVLYSLQEIYGIEKKCSIISSNNACDDERELESSSIESDAKKKTIKASNTSGSISTNSTATTTTMSTSSTNSSGSSSLSSSPPCSVSDSVRLNNELKLKATLDEQKRRQEQEIEQELKGIECVICMCETRDTLILPCRHLCLCKMCAINLRIQSNNCPICRIPFIALVQLKLLRKKDKKIKKEEQEEKESNSLNVLPADENYNKLPVLKLEHLNRSNSSFDNVIIEESFEIKSEVELRKEILVNCENTSAATKNTLTVQQNCKQMRLFSLFDSFEAVTIYEAFNESNSQQFIVNNKQKSCNSRKKTNKDAEIDQNQQSNKKRTKKLNTLKPIESNDGLVVLNTSEAGKEYGENLNPSESKILNVDKNMGEEKIENDEITRKNEPDILPVSCELKNYEAIRSKSVIVNPTYPLVINNVRSSSYVGNFGNKINQTEETIPMNEFQLI